MFKVKRIFYETSIASLHYIIWPMEYHGLLKRQAVERFSNWVFSNYSELIERTMGSW